MSDVPEAPRQRVSRWSNLRTQLALIVAIALSPAGILAVFQAITFAEDEADRVIQRLEDRARIEASRERESLVEIRENLSAMARLLAAADLSGSKCDDVLRSLALGKPWLQSAVALSKDGTVICGDTLFLGGNQPAGWKEFVRAPRFTLGSPRANVGGGAETIVAYYPIHSADRPLFALGAAIHMSYFTRLISEIDHDGITRLPIALIDNRGNILAESGANGTLWLPGDTAFVRKIISRTSPARGRDGIDRNLISQPLIVGQLWAVTGVPSVGFWDVLLTRRGLGVLAPILLWFIAVAVTYLTIDRIVTKHVIYLRRVTERIGHGDLATPIRSFSGAPDEIHALGEAVRQMATSLSDRDIRLRELLATQRSLLLEIHHRVKNNLQMISSLMNMQLRNVDDTASRHALQTIQDRIHGLALVHQNLYATERLDHVALDHLVRDIASHLSASLVSENVEVVFDFELDPVVVDADVATPIALFLTEALGNVFKHARVDDNVQTISVVLSQDDDAFSLEIRNAAVDAGATQVASGPSGLGSRLIQGFARQLGGAVDIRRDDGTYIVCLAAPTSRNSGPFKLHKNERPVSEISSAPA